MGLWSSQMESSPPRRRIPLRSRPQRSDLRLDSIRLSTYLLLESRTTSTMTSEYENETVVIEPSSSSFNPTEGAELTVPGRTVQRLGLVIDRSR